jgi:hypothetical protein
MSNGQAALVTENGVPSVPVEETPSFKVLLHFCSTLQLYLIFSFERSLLEISPTLPPMMG